MRMCVPILVSSALCTVLTFHVASAIASAQMGMHPASHSLQYRLQSHVQRSGWRKERKHTYIAECDVDVAVIWGLGMPRNAATRKGRGTNYTWNLGNCITSAGQGQAASRLARGRGLTDDCGASVASRAEQGDPSVHNPYPSANGSIT